MNALAARRRHPAAIALLLFTFVCKIAVQAQASAGGHSDVPKSLLLSRIAPRQPIPSAPIDERPIIAAIRRE